MAIVYKITNTINNKCYVGQTIYDLEHRWKRHLSAAKNGSKFRFHSAIRKYGPDPWSKEVIFEDDNLDLVREYEAKIIIDENLIISGKGYNAKPGGCGGWIVTNYETWVEKQRLRSQGLNNSNAGTTTNEDMINLLVDLSKEKGYIPRKSRFCSFAKTKGYHIPKHFTSFRFGGKYANLAKEVEQITGLIYNPYYRDDEYKQKIRNANIGKIKVIMNETNKITLVKPENFDIHTMTRVKRKIND